MTTPTKIRPKIATPTPGELDEPLEAMQLLPAGSNPTLDDMQHHRAEFAAWAGGHDLHSTFGSNDRGDYWVELAFRWQLAIVHPGFWVVLHHDHAGLPYLEVCDQEHLDATYDIIRPLRVETYRTVAVLRGTSGVTEPRYHWRVRHTSNGEIMASGESYTDTRDRDHAIDVLWPDLEVVEGDQ